VTVKCSRIYNNLYFMLRFSMFLALDLHQEILASHTCHFWQDIYRLLLWVQCWMKSIHTIGLFNKQ
jgi:hypothetical protein